MLRSKRALATVAATLLSALLVPISAGPAGEAGQVLDFQVTNSHNALFGVQPAVQPDGTLTFTPVPGAAGVATVTVRLHDSGGSVGDMDDATVVTETNLDDAVSYTKGCYLGQEIIARIKYRGHVAKKLRGLVFERPAIVATGTSIKSRDDKEIGVMTSTTYSPVLGRRIGLGYVKYDFIALGTEVIIGDNRAKVSELPFLNQPVIDGVEVSDGR